MTSKKELEAEIRDLQWKLDKATQALGVEEGRVEHYREEVERLNARASSAAWAIRVLAPQLHSRYRRGGRMNWEDLIADAKRVEEYNATTEVLHFIEASQEGEPF